MKTTTSTARATTKSAKSNANSKQPVPEGPGDEVVAFFVPISVGCGQRRAEDGTCKQTTIDSVAWRLVDARSGRPSGPLRSLDLLGQSSAGETLESALGQIEADLRAACGRSRLLAWGPLHLRQFLHPAAAQANVALASHFHEYLDLAKEFAALERVRQTAESCWSSPPPPTTTADYCYCCACWFETSRLTVGCACEQQQQVGEERSPVGLGGLSAPEQQCCSWPRQHQARGEAPLGPSCSMLPPAERAAACTGNRAQQQQLENLLKTLSLEPPVASKCENCLPESGECASQQQQQEEGPANSNNNSASTGGHCCSLCSSLANARLVESMCLAIERLLAEGHQFGQPERIRRRVELVLCANANDNDKSSPAGLAAATVVRARGLPWQASEQDISRFFAGLDISKGGLALCLSKQGRRNGEALIKFESREQRDLALSRHKHYMGARYIEVYRASCAEFQQIASGYNSKAQGFLAKGARVIVRMRGLPYTCTGRQVVEFFAGQQAESGQKCEVFGGERGVLLVKNQHEKPTGDAFVLFASEEFAQRALRKHRQNIGNRYVELFRSTFAEFQQVLSMSEHSTSQQEQSRPTTPTIRVTNTVTHNFNSGDGAEPGGLRQQVGVASGRGRSKERQIALAAVTYAQVATKSGPGQQRAAGGQAVSPRWRARPAACELPELAQENCERRAPTRSTRSDSPPSSLGATNHKLAATQTGGSGVSDSSAFDNNSVNSSPSSASEGEDERDQLADCQPACGSKQNSSSAAQSPVSSVSATSAGSSSYKSPRHTGQPSHKHHHKHQAPNFHQYCYQHQCHSQSYQQPQFGVSSASNAHQVLVLAPISGQQHQYQQAGVQSTHAMPASYQYQHGVTAAAHLPLPAYSLPLYGPQLHQQAAQHQLVHLQPTGGGPCEGAHEPNCVRLRGLPFEAQVEDVLHFLGESSKHIVFAGVHLVYNALGHFSGEAIVQMSSCESASLVAKAFHRKVMRIGRRQRYIEVIPSSIKDLSLALGLHLATARQPSVDDLAVTAASALATRTATSGRPIASSESQPALPPTPAKTMPTVHVAPAATMTAGQHPTNVNSQVGQPQYEEDALGGSSKQSQAAVAQAQTALPPTSTAYYPIIYYYPQHLLYHCD